jgi:hypothetical protein
MSKKTKAKEWELKSKYLACPREVVESLFAGGLSVLDMKIFFVIQSLSKTEKGCFLKNESFARLCKVTECSVKRTISRLKELDLIRQIGWDGHRRFLRSTYYCKEENGESLGKISNETAGEKPMPPGHPAPMLPGHPAPAPIYYIYNKVKNMKTKNIPARNERGCDADGNSLIGKKDERTIWEKMAGHFKNHIPGDLAKRSIVSKDAKMLKSFCKRESIDLQRIKKIMRWYSSQFDKEKNPYSRKYLPLYVPQAVSMRGFCEKFVGIECAMLREGDDPQPQQNEMPKLTKKEEERMEMMKYQVQFPSNAKMETFPRLVHELSVSFDRYRERVLKEISDETTRQFYLNSFFTEFHFFLEYSLFISEEVRQWKGWSGDFSIFVPREKHFKRYVQHIVREGNYGFDNDLKGILEI